MCMLYAFLDIVTHCHFSNKKQFRKVTKLSFDRVFEELLISPRRLHTSKHLDPWKNCTLLIGGGYYLKVKVISYRCWFLTFPGKETVIVEEGGGGRGYAITVHKVGHNLINLSRLN